MKVLGLSGWRRSGKDTAGDFLRQHGFMRVAYADALKANVAKFYGLSDAHLTDQKLKEEPLLEYPAYVGDKGSLGIVSAFMKELCTASGNKLGQYDIMLYTDGCAYHSVDGEKLYWTPRALMIMEGTSKRAVHKDYWVMQAINKIDQMSESFKNFYISDVRYKSEAESMKKEYGSDFVSVRINRYDDCPSTDASERDMDDYVFDYVIDNKGTLAEFEAKVSSLVLEVF
jgi:hypothetical protein